MVTQEVRKRRGRNSHFFEGPEKRRERRSGGGVHSQLTAKWPRSKPSRTYLRSKKGMQGGTLKIVKPVQTEPGGKKKKKPKARPGTKRLQFDQVVGKSQ